MKRILIYLLALILVGSQAFSCEVVDPSEDSEVVTPGQDGDNPDQGGDQPGQGDGTTDTPGPDPDPTPDPEPTPSSAYYEKVTRHLDDWSGEYILAFSTSTAIHVFNSWSGSDKGTSTVNLASKNGSSGIPSTDGDPYMATIAKVGDSYSLYIKGLGYIGCESSSNNTLHKRDTAPGSSDTKYLWKFSYQNTLWITNVAYSSRKLQWNTGANCFRCYTGGQKDLTLYKRTKLSGGVTPTPTPDPETPTPEPEVPTPDPEPDPTPDPTPIPDPTPTPTPDPNDNCPNDWYELPTINYSKESDYYTSQHDKYGKLYYAHHICKGGEKYAHSGSHPYNGKPMRNYTVCFSEDHHCPVWVAAPRHKRYESGVNRKDAYKSDPKIPSDVQYKKKDADSGCNNGHMLGSAERLSSRETNNQVFYFSNIAPQYSDTFNTGGGAWNNLEEWVDGHVCSDTLYVVIGAYFDDYSCKSGSATAKRISFGGRSDVSCPTMFYYALLRTKQGNSGKALSECSASEMQCVAIVRSHKAAKGRKNFAEDMMSVSDLEKITGFTYFQNVPQAPKSTYKASDWGE